MKNGLVLLVLVVVSFPAFANGERLAARCALKGRNLEIEAVGAKGERLLVGLADYVSLRNNPALGWSVEPGSSSHVTYIDDFGFPWGPKLGSSPASLCRVAVRRNAAGLEMDVACDSLRSQDDSLPGFLNVPAWRLACTF